MNADLLYNIRKPFMKEKDGIILDVNDLFLTLTEFSRNELCGKYIIGVLNELFRCKDSINLTDGETQAVLFTKTLDVRFVTIEKYEDFNNNINLYIFDEIEDSRLDTKLLFIENLINDNKIGIGIFTSPDLKLIKANQKYLNYFPKPFNTKEVVYGKCMNEILHDFEESGTKEAFTSAINLNKPVYAIEKQGLILESDDYWDSTLTPIAEHGEVKYIMSMLENVTERVLSRKHIQRKNNQLVSIIESVEDIISIVDKDGKYIKQSNLMSEILGENEDRYLGCSNHVGKYYDLIGNTIPLKDLCFMNLLKGIKVKGQKVKYVCDNKEYYLILNAIPILDENGEFEMGVIITNDITDEILKKKEIQMQNRQLNAIIECIYDTVTLIDKNGNYIKRSDILNNYLGRSNKNFESTPQRVKFYDLNDNLLSLEDLCTSKLLKGEKVKDHKIKMVKGKDEIYVSESGIPILDENEQFEMGVMITHDITELVKSNKLISSQKKELEIVFDNMSDGLAVVDKNGNYIKKNKALNEAINKNNTILLDFNRIGETITKGQKYYSDNDEELVLEELPFHKILKGETVKKQRVVIKNELGNIYLDFNAVPIFDETGDFKYGILVANDITHIIEKKNKIKQQQQLVIEAEQEKLKAIEKALTMKDEFISLITHEFKTPLNVIYSAIQLVESVYISQIPDRVKGLIKNIKQNTFRQLRLVNNLLDITRLNSGQFKLNIKNIDVVSLTRQIYQSVKLYSDQKHINLLFTCSINCKNIAIDDEKLERILLNLLSNAIKFTDEGGKITVSLDENKKTNMIVIEVSDTGIGIPKDKQETIFERFGQVDSDLSKHAEGTGIGLSLVKKLVDILDGNIELESELGNGSTFRITLPANKYIEKEEYGALFDGENRLVNALNVEFSDIYL